LRASDADRERIAGLLRDAATEGRLDLHELDDRLSQVYASRTYAELEPLTRDIPAAARSGQLLRRPPLFPLPMTPHCRPRVWGWQ
jgi:Domain of unknown function (DUF1707)